jgi:alginate O-acetyltransferase complex protein AlgJ
MKAKGFHAGLLAAVFITIIFFPLLNKSLALVKDSENTENRAPAEMPELDISYLDGFPKKYDQYYSDNFSLRQLLIKSYNYLNLLVFKKSPVPEVIIGNNGWLYLGGNENDVYTGKNPLTSSELEEFRLELEYRKKYLESRGIRFYVLIAPVKATIYPEYMAMNSFRKRTLSWGEQLHAYLRANTDLNVPDVITTLRNRKNIGQLYSKIDNHWNARGAFYIANYTLSKISSQMQGVDTLQINRFYSERSVTTHGNISTMLSNCTFFTDTAINLTPVGGFKSVRGVKTGYPVVANFPYVNEYEEVRINKDPSKPGLLIISDSFGGAIFPYLAESFSKTTKIFDGWQYKLNEEIIEKEKPDVVILLMLESNMKNFLKYQSRKKEALASN